MIDIPTLTLFRIASFVCLQVLVIGFWLGTKPEWVGLFPIDPPADKVVHFFVFGFIAALLWLSEPRLPPLVIFSITSLVGSADELHQLYIPERTASFADFITDLIGIILTMTILKYTQRRFTPQIS